MMKCDYCGNKQDVKYVTELINSDPGVHLCDVCRGGVSRDGPRIRMGYDILLMPLTFYPGQVMQKLIPRMLD